MSEEWHDGLPCPTEEGQPGGVLEIGLRIVLCLIVIYVAQLLTLAFHGSANRHTIQPNFSLVNKASLDNFLKAEVFVNEDNNQLRATHLILGYTPISRAF